MRNPLYKRIKREFVSDIGKYIVIFLFIVIMVGILSGYNVGNSSMKKSFYANMETFNVEDGHFETEKPLSDSIISNEENKLGLKMYSIFYKTLTHTVEEKYHNIRTYSFSDRKGIIDGYEIVKGIEPTQIDEIALDRAYCDANKIKVGDTFETDVATFKVVGFVALIDYSSLFENNSDAMMNVQSFSIAIVTKEAFDSFSVNEHYNYAYKYNDDLSEDETNKKDEILMKDIYLSGILGTNRLIDFVPLASNQAIQFAIDDIKNDLVFLDLFGYIIIAGLAFVFALTTKNRIEQEAKTIGTLKAMGYTTWNLVGHYILLPALITLAGALVGNLIGYTYFKDFTTGLYYRSYSLGSYKTYFDLSALFTTTLIPLALVILISLIILAINLNVPTKAFLQGKTKTKRKSTVCKLPKKMSIMNKMQFRIITHNKSTYAAMFIGLLFANLLLVFGFSLTPMLNRFSEEILNSQVAPYVYVLKEDYAVSNENVEKIKVANVDYEIDAIEVIGVEKFWDQSEYLTDINLNRGEVVVSKDLYDKYKLKKGDIITAIETYTGKTFDFKISAFKDQAGAFYVYMDMDTFNEYFKDSQTLPGYLSSEELTEIPEDKIYTIITIKELQVGADQMSMSMGDVFSMFYALAIIMCIMIIYLLARIVIEKNNQSIAMMKILGFSQFEINRAYNLSTGIVVLISEIISIPIDAILLKVVWEAFMKVRMKGWITFYLAPWIYFAMFGIGIGSFLIVFLIEHFKTKKIPLSLALKRE